jgi:nitrite reductase/ring-hydroxylating ferredoxin subunit
VIILEAVGVILLSSGAWMGGKLVSRNQISVDHRYAGAGRWHEDTVREPDGTPIPVALAGELQPDQMKLLHIGHQRIVLARTEKGFVAFEDHCTHRGGSLADGVLICDTVQCPWHGSQFDVRTGAPRSGPAGEGIHVYRVEERGGEVCLLL